MTDISPEEIFVRGVWKRITDEEDASWVKNVASTPLKENEAFGDYGPILKEMLDKGISPETIVRFEKIIGYNVAFDLLYLLGDPQASYEDFPDEEQIVWNLRQSDPEALGNDKDMSCMYELMLSMDPSGRGMRPKKK